ncbi:MAG: AEC family transporter [Halanaerobiaceae bacterium]
MNLHIIVNEILVLFFIILIGFILRKKDIINENLNRGLSGLLTEIIAPALIIHSLVTLNPGPQLINNLKLIIIATAASYLFAIIIANLLARLIPCSPDKKTVFIFLLVFGNVGYMGIPVISTIYPENGVVYTTMNVLIFNILIWTYGVFLFAKDNKKGKFQWKRLLNNGLMGILLGFCLMTLQIDLGPIYSALELIGNMMFPLSMLIIGASLTEIKIKDILKDKILYLIIFLKLLLIPLAALFIMKPLYLPEVVSNVSLVLLAMPSAAFAVIFAEKYNGDYKFASEGVFFTTLLSVLTLPLFIWLIRVL